MMEHAGIPLGVYFSRMRSEGFPFIVWGSGGWTRVRFVCCVPAVASRSRRGCVVNSVGACVARGRWTCVSRGRRGTPDALTRSRRHWPVDPRGRCGETCIWTLVRVRFAWQVWDFGCIDALWTAVNGGSAWQVWGNVHLDVAACAFHVAGVGQGGHRRCRERGFAWPAWGSVHAACVSRGRRGEWCDRWPRWVSFCVAGAGNRAP